jgi:hypothetical protein
MDQIGQHLVAVRYVWIVLEVKQGEYQILSKNRNTAMSYVIHVYQE